MSAETLPSNSSSDRGESQSGTEEAMDVSAYVRALPEDERINLCYHLDQNNAWEKVARQMGYTLNDIMEIMKMAQDKHISPAEQLLSVWGDANHTVTELFMILRSIDQHSAMDCLKKFVDERYHRLISDELPDLNALLGRISGQTKINNNATSRKISNGSDMSETASESELNTESIEESSKIVGHCTKKIEDLVSRIPTILYSDLALATGFWSKENILGRGGFGTVFKGRWKYTDVAIKKIEYKSDDMKKNAKVQMQQSLNELRYLNSCRHDNILPLYGYSVDGPEPCLVYQFMAGGSVERRLYVKTAGHLSFTQRKRIALGTARGLQYLHTYLNGKPLIHGDIKPANILLDPCCMPRIGDFGLVREGSDELMAVSSVYGTRPYLPMEFLANRIFSTKIDTFSYGVVIFELFTALKAYDTNRGADKAFLAKFMWLKCQNNEQMAPLIDETLDPATVSMPLYETLMKIGLVCTHENAANRPEMVEVLNVLEKMIDKDERINY
ncbi:serine/threonine-protein kinase pelle-like [Sitodiplosis mosellana]|uniref:serine/threonine-protein kinase pelle-like n=1 Tax=Sitodiplosis mosellana TaxID=263140 RepID=UPI00244391F5|nr:serine/threonine-protein kinase pelle-like [Sitodiplosis mosellana]